ncbi:MerR family transcriptional regulator [Halovulum dunhuangense]|uniref:MerR family transcriptional regulator n=2 Tax=Halovulum dunhuangense TaxID=1505036 RepID=A0A849L7Q4_9RHOB|nr:MerR family transcriptional regulator [Halovulum dunhuangense]
MEQRLTLEEISERTGVERRTLRSWVAEGLLAGPFKPGRGATYPEGNVERALAVRALKEIHGQSFAEIRKRLMLAGEDEIRRWAAEAQSVSPKLSPVGDYLRRVREKGAPPPPPASMSAPMSFERDDLDEGAPPRRSAGIPASKAVGEEARAERELRSLYERLAETGREDRYPPKFARVDVANGARGPVISDLAGIEALLAVLGSAGNGAPSRRARGTEWFVIPVTPDLHLSVRGDLSPRERAMLERVADLIRMILSGGLQDDDH